VVVERKEGEREREREEGHLDEASGKATVKIDR